MTARTELPAALITPHNIEAGSLSVDYASGQVADEIVMTYIDASDDWQPREVRRRTVDQSLPVRRSATSFLRGVTSFRQAAEEANLAAARQSLHKRAISWIMNLEALSFKAQLDGLGVAFTDHRRSDRPYHRRLARPTGSGPRYQDRPQGGAAGQAARRQAPSVRCRTGEVRLVQADRSAAGGGGRSVDRRLPVAAV